MLQDETYVLADRYPVDEYTARDEFVRVRDDGHFCIPTNLLSKI